MSGRQTVETRAVGYRWFISVEKEMRCETGAKYPDKTVVHASLEGNCDSLDDAEVQVVLAKAKLVEVTGVREG